MKPPSPPCIFTLSLLGSLKKEGQAGVIRPVATGRMTVRTGTSAPGIRCGVMRPLAGSVRAHCPKLEPLLEHDNSKIIVARIYKYESEQYTHPLCWPRCCQALFAASPGRSFPRFGQRCQRARPTPQTVASLSRRTGRL